MDSQDFDDLYEHNNEKELKEMEDKDELTFGSRPPTAP